MYIESSQQPYPTQPMTSSVINFYPIESCHQPLSKIKDEISNQAIAPISIIQIYNNNYGTPVPSVQQILEGQNQVGKSNWDILYKSTQYDELTKQVNEIRQEFRQEIADLKQEIVVLKQENVTLKQEIVKLNHTVHNLSEIITDHLVEPMIRNTAGQAILWFLGEQPQTVSRSHRFAKDSPAYEKLVNFIETENIEFNVKAMSNQFNAIIDRRNASVHPTLEKMTIDVEKCLSYFEQFPQLKTTYKYELLVLQLYPQLKKYFDSA
jgi:DNA-binding transcriptional MerR regulator